MLPTDYVVKACVVENKNCELKKKCAECIKEMKALDEIDEMFRVVCKFTTNQDNMFEICE
jgi:hypothetical protein